MQNEEGVKVRGRGEVMVSFQRHRNDWSTFAKGTFSGIELYRDTIKRMLKSIKRTAFWNPRIKKVQLMVGNPRLSRLFEVWGRKNTKAVSYHLCYYVRQHKPQNINTHTPGDDIDISLVVVNYEINECSVFFFRHDIHKNHTEEEMISLFNQDIDKYVIARYQGYKTSHERSFFLSLTQRIVTNSDKDNKDNDESHILLSFRTIDKDLPLPELVVGHYVGRGPAGGICILERCSPDRLPEKLGKWKVSPEYRRKLMGKTYSYGKNKDLYQVKRDTYFFNILHAYSGSYAGIQLAGNSRKGAIQLLRLTIEENGRVMLGGDKEELCKHGRILSIKETDSERKGEDLSITCWLNFDYTTDQYQQLLILRVAPAELLDHPEMGKHIIGEFCGFALRSNQIESGRILFSPLVTGQSFTPTTIPKDDDEKFNKFINENPNLLSILGGLKDHQFRLPYRLKPGYMERRLFAKFHQGEAYRSDSYEGNYQLYYPSSDGSKIYEKVLVIGDKETDTHWYDAYRRGFSEYFLGACVMIGKNLTIQFNEKVEIRSTSIDPDRKKTFRTLVFKRGNMDSPTPADKTVLTGMIYRQNQDGEPVMSDIVAVRRDDSLDNLLTAGFNEYIDTEITNTMAGYEELLKLFKTQEKKGKEAET